MTEDEAREITEEFDEDFIAAIATIARGQNISCMDALVLAVASAVDVMVDLDRAAARELLEASAALVAADDEVGRAVASSRRSSAALALANGYRERLTLDMPTQGSA